MNCIVCSVVVPFRKHVLSWPSPSRWYYVFMHQLVTTQCALCILWNAYLRSCVCLVGCVVIEWRRYVWMWIWMCEYGCARLSLRYPTRWLWTTHISAYFCDDLTLYDLMWSFSARVSVCVSLLCGWVSVAALPCIMQLSLVTQRWSPSSWKRGLRWMPGIRLENLTRQTTIHTLPYSMRWEESVCTVLYVAWLFHFENMFCRDHHPRDGIMYSCIS